MSEGKKSKANRCPICGYRIRGHSHVQGRHHLAHVRSRLLKPRTEK